MLAEKRICVLFIVCMCISSKRKIFWRLSLTIIDGRGCCKRPGFPGRHEYQRATVAAGTKPIA